MARLEKKTMPEVVTEKREGDRRRLGERRKTERRSWDDDHWILPPGMEQVSGRRKPLSNRRRGLADRRVGVAERRAGLSERRGFSSARMGRATDSNVRVLMDPQTFEEKTEGIVSITGRHRDGRYIAPTYKPPASGQLEPLIQKTFSESWVEFWRRLKNFIGF